MVKCGNHCVNRSNDLWSGQFRIMFDVFKTTVSQIWIVFQFDEFGIEDIDVSVHENGDHSDQFVKDEVLDASLDQVVVDPGEN